MPCRICTHEQHDALLAELPTQSLRVLEERYHISRSVLSRHRAVGCPQGTQRAFPDRTGGELQRVVALLEDIKALLETLVQHQGEAEGTGAQASTIPWNRL